MAWIIEVKTPEKDIPYYLTIQGIADVSGPICIPSREDATHFGRRQDAETMIRTALPWGEAAPVELHARG